MKKIYMVTVNNYEWETTSTRMFSSLQNAIKFANMYSTFKDEGTCRRFDENEEFNEKNWGKVKHVTISYSECTGKRWVYIEELKIDNFGGIADI